MRVPVGYMQNTSSLQVFELYIHTCAEVQEVNIWGRSVGYTLLILATGI